MIIRHLEKMFSTSKRPNVDRKRSIDHCGQSVAIPYFRHRENDLPTENSCIAAVAATGDGSFRCNDGSGFLLPSMQVQQNAQDQNTDGVINRLK